MRRTVVAVVVVVLAAGCASSAPPATQPTSTSSPATTTATSDSSTTSTTVEEPTTTSAVSTTTTTDVYYTLKGVTAGVEPPILGESNGANGTGCSPGGGPLPDGVWFGWVTWTAERSLGFDLACLYTGSDAHDAAEARGIESYDWRFITNDSHKERTVAVAPETPVRETWFFARPSGTHIGPYSDWPQSNRGSLCSSSLDYCSVWIAVNEGNITEVVEFPVPSNTIGKEGLAAAGTTFTPADGQYVTEPRIVLYWTYHQFQPQIHSINGRMVSAYSCFDQEMTSGVWRCPAGDVAEWPSWTQQWVEGVNTVKVILNMDQQIVLGEQRTAHLVPSLVVRPGRVTDHDAQTTIIDISGEGPTDFDVSPEAVVLLLDPNTQVPASAVVAIAQLDPGDLVGYDFDVYTTAAGDVIQLVQR